VSVRVLILGGSMAMAAACSDKSSAVDPPVAPACITVGARVVPGSATIQSGDTLRARVIDPPCSAPMQYTWSSSDTSHAKVDSLSGLIQGRLPGLVTITASAVSDPAVKGAMALTVVPRS
jgi:hypothetical protein